MEATDLTSGSHHFQFGRNWADYSKSIDQRRIDAATAGLSSLLGVSSLSGMSFLDIGCGSGIHSLAALRLGANKVLALDIDPDSVATTRSVLAMHGTARCWQVERRSVFELGEIAAAGYDVVYSWGVLHHTGSLVRALRAAAEAVAPGGVMAVALYRPIWTERFWKLEKRWYRRASPRSQWFVRRAYRCAFDIGLIASGRSPAMYHSQYDARRGMSYEHYAHDWLGGWPYESIGADELAAFMGGLGLRLDRRGNRARGMRERMAEVLGSGCDEFVFRRDGAQRSPMGFMGSHLSVRGGS